MRFLGIQSERPISLIPKDLTPDTAGIWPCSASASEHPCGDFVKPAGFLSFRGEFQGEFEYKFNSASHPHPRPPPTPSGARGSPTLDPEKSGV